tara:strand:- start:6251 stop:6922 length:672 start_codon:yes stop_codon:yes gene_type:complete
VTGFLNIFASSPFKPIQEHMDKVFECASLLPEFIEAVYAQNWEQARLLQGQISKLEGEADEIKQQIRLQMPHSLFMPVSRSDLLELLREQDYIANETKDVAGIILGRTLDIPEPIREGFSGFINACLSAAEKASKAVSELEDLLETGFKGREVRIVKQWICELDQLERETDEIQVQIRGELFTFETNIPPIDAMFLYKIFDKAGAIADHAQKVGHRLQLLIAS